MNQLLYDPLEILANPWESIIMDFVGNYIISTMIEIFIVINLDVITLVVVCLELHQEGLRVDPLCCLHILCDSPDVHIKSSIVIVNFYGFTLGTNHEM